MKTQSTIRLTTHVALRTPSHYKTTSKSTLYFYTRNILQHAKV